MSDDQDPLSVAVAMRWRIVRDVVLDPFAWVGVAVVGLSLWVLGGRLGPGPAAVALPLGLSAAAALLWADFLLFQTPENELLRTQPLGATGLLRLRRAELGWWWTLPAGLAAAFAFGGDGLPAAAATFGGARVIPGAALRAAVAGRRFGARGPVAAAAILVALAGSSLLWPTLVAAALPGWAFALGVLVLTSLAGRSPDGGLAARYEQRASGAASARTRPRGRTLRPLLAWLPLPAPVRARVTRDVLLMTRGEALRASSLLLLAPLSVFTLRLDPAPTGDALLWQLLTAAALGGGAVAWAVGPGLHAARMEVVAWERSSPEPGRGALLGALALASLLALALSVGLLAFVGSTRHGWFLAELPPLVAPVLALPWAMAHFAVAFTLSRATHRGVVGESMLAYALPVVAIGVAIGGFLYPAALPLYLLVTAGMTAEAVSRMDRLEVPA